jgi:hydroxymethylpyrimidine pyrophosphatase-like HAD family hydrolase
LYFLALATDYDGTIATEGAVEPETCAALEDLKRTGRRLILVTGRELPELLDVFPPIELFDIVVAENGALLYYPRTKEERVIAPPPSDKFIARLASKNVTPVSVGRSIVATWEPHQTAVLEAIHELGLELQIIFNKGAVMVLPAGVNKATGLAAALEELHMSRHNVVGVGDAENDHAFLRACGCSAAVANALPMVKDTADIRLKGARGAGVAELVRMVMERDIAIVAPGRHGLVVGTESDGTEVHLGPTSGIVLIAGGSSIRELVAGLTRQMAEREFHFCMLDPEGRYAELDKTVSVGDGAIPPQTGEIDKLVVQGMNVVVNMSGLDARERPAFVANLLPELQKRRAETGRPHWILIEDGHELLPSEHPKAVSIMVLSSTPERIDDRALSTVKVVLAAGREAPKVVASFAISADVPVPAPAPDELLFWNRERGPRLVRADGLLASDETGSSNVSVAQGEAGAWGERGTLPREGEGDRSTT